MLDDVNLLSQFGADDYTEIIINNIEHLAEPFEAKLLPKSHASITKVFLVTDNRFNLGFQWLKVLFSNSAAATDCLLIETSEVKLAHLDSRSLVIFESNWINQDELFRQLKLTSKAKTLVILLDELDLELWPMLGYLVQILINFRVLNESDRLGITKSISWLKAEALKLLPSKSIAHNIAKQLAVMLVGKSILFIPSQKTIVAAQTFKYFLGHNSHNITFMEPLINLVTDDLAWTAQPVERPYGVVDLVSAIDDPIYNKYLKLKNRRLSGLMPAGQLILIKGDTDVEVMIYGYVLAAFCSVYLAVLNKQPLPKK